MNTPKIVKIFYLFASLLMLLFILLTTLRPHKTQANYAEALVSLSQLPFFALSTGFLEYRVPLYDDFSGALYPEMHHYKEMGFLYGE